MNSKIRRTYYGTSEKKKDYKGRGKQALLGI